MAEHISSLDAGYKTGMLSVFPEALDDYESLYRATNSAKIPLKQTLTYNGKRIIVEDTSLFPANGIIRVGGDIGADSQFEEIYYASKTNNTFEDLIRGFCGTQQGTWQSKTTYISNAVFAEHHNSIKDCLINMEIDVGVQEFPDALSLNGILKSQEVRFLAPKPLFRAFPIQGPPPLTVRFQNFSSGNIARFLWDFGDGGSSLDKSPIHTYVSEGVYSVKLNVATTLGAQGIATKIGYITVSNDESFPFFYVDSINNPYSIQTATSQSLIPRTFTFVDQSQGAIVQRNWIFGDGTTFTQQDPDIHDITHQYKLPGEYVVSQLIQFTNGRLKRVELPTQLVVL